MVFLRWLKAVFGHWKTELIGGLLIGALAFYSDMTATRVPPRIYEIAAGLLLLWSMFLAWHDERDARLKAEIETAKIKAESDREREKLEAELASRRPDLSWKIESCVQLMTFLAQREGYGTNIAFTISARNGGAQTALSDWTLDIPGVTSGPVEPRSDPWQEMLIKQQGFDDLASVSQAGIGSGAIVRGALIFLIPNLTLLSFTDAHGRTYVGEPDTIVRSQQKL